MKIRDLLENQEYNNWSMPSNKVMESDFNEYKFKEDKKWKDRASNKGFRFPIFKNYNDYVKSLSQGKVITITSDLWNNIDNLSKNSSIEDIENMVSGYVMPRDVRRIKVGFENNDKIPYPVILKGTNGLFIMSGNTRLNVADVLGITPKAILVDVSE